MEANILVTGGCGFIGSHFVAHLLETQGSGKVINIDALTYAAHPETENYLAGIAPDRYKFYQLDITDPKLDTVLETERVTHLVNFAAESHVDRSILDPGLFVRTNITGTQNLLSLCRARHIRYVQVSTDEVYGSLSPIDLAFTEKSPIDPSSPYAASKAAADLLVQAAYKTFGQEVIITRCSNNFGPFQFPEKLIPLVIANALEEKEIPVYGDGQQIRDWLYVRDHCTGIEAVLKNGKPGRVYNISGNEEHPNIKIICQILDLLEKPHSLITFVKDRPGHDRRYALNSQRLSNELGWKPQYTFEKALKETVQWYLDNSKWWKQLRDGAFADYYDKNYKNKFAQDTRGPQ